MKMEGSLACAGNDWEKAWGRGREKDFQLFHVRGKLQQYKDPLVFLKQTLLWLYLPTAVWNERHIRALCDSFLHTLFRVLTLKNGSPSWFEQRTLRCLSSIPLGLCARFLFFPLLFSGGNLFPLLSSPKGFPSASDYLWLQLVSRQPSGPVWRLRSLFSPPDGTEGGREAGTRVNWVGRLNWRIARVGF